MQKLVYRIQCLSSFHFQESMFKQDTMLSSGQGFSNTLSNNQNICSRLHMVGNVHLVLTDVLTAFWRMYSTVSMQFEHLLRDTSVVYTSLFERVLCVPMKVLFVQSLPPQYGHLSNTTSLVCLKDDPLHTDHVLLPPLQYRLLSVIASPVCPKDGRLLTNLNASIIRCTETTIIQTFLYSLVLKV